MEEVTKQIAIVVMGLVVIVLVVAGSIQGYKRIETECLTQVLASGVTAQEAKEVCK